MMSKNICLLMILMLCSVAMSAQSNLQFGRVITYAGTLTTTTATGDSTATWTVPAGKVWKIESVSSAYAYTTLPVYLVMNGIKIYDIVTTTSSSTTRTVYLPIWLKAGDAIRIAEYSTSNNFFANYFISMVEFNLTP